MKNRRSRAIGTGFAVLVILVVTLMIANSLRRSSHIVLPSTAGSSAQSADPSQSGGDAVLRVEITPETVQSAIATLHREESYARLLTLETFWSGGSGTAQCAVSASGGLLRTDLTGTDGRVRHTITDGETTYIWYDYASAYYTAAAGDITADEEQRIPTYEDILALESGRISDADYRSFAEQRCIYVETAADGDGYAQRYWVSVDNGLLIGAERLADGELIFRMTEQAAETAAPKTADFTLPDGTVLRELP